MEYKVETIKQDAAQLSSHDFFEKYYLSNDVWYIDYYMKSQYPSANSSMSVFKSIFSEHLGLSEDHVFISGSAKYGFSLSKKRISDESGTREALFLPFNIDSTCRKISDIDITIVSEEWFNTFWKLYRTSYAHRFAPTYEHIIRDTYRGFINERNVLEIPQCRIIWDQNMKTTLRELRRTMRFQHEMSIRIYRTIWDYEDYSSTTLRTLKKEVQI